jgi:hypothetical protein
MLLGCCAALAEEAAGPALEKNLVILYTSDIHCGVEAGWGYAGLYAIKEYYAKDNHVLLVDDGDAIQGEPIGTMTKGESIIDIMNAMGYDLAIPGNHEFDYGMDTFLSLTEKANFPYLSCNFNKEGELVFAPYAIKEFDGVKFGFVGVTTPTTLRSSTPKYFMDENGKFIYGFLEDETGEAVYTAVQNAVDAARAEGAEREGCIDALALLAGKAGIYGMVGGQCLDVEAEEKELSLTQEQLLYVYENKTAALLQAALGCGAALAGTDAAAKNRADLEKAGYDLGIAFQLQDDILDIESTTEELGKPVGSDERNGKKTYVSYLGMEGAKREQARLSEEAAALVRALATDGSERAENAKEFLAELIEQLVNRKK